MLTISRWSGFTGEEAATGLTRSDLLDAVELQLRRDGVPLITLDGGNFRTPYLYIYVDVDQHLGLYGSGRITSRLSINYVRGVGLFVFLD